MTTNETQPAAAQPSAVIRVWKWTGEPATSPDTDRIVLVTAGSLMIHARYDAARRGFVSIGSGQDIAGVVLWRDLTTSERAAVDAAAATVEREAAASDMTPQELYDGMRTFLTSFGNPRAADMTPDELFALVDYLAAYIPPGLTVSELAAAADNPPDVDETPEEPPAKIPGSFVDGNGSARRLKFFRIGSRHMRDPQAGGELVEMKRYRANTADGVLIAGVSTDPVPRVFDDGVGLLHISLSHRAPFASIDDQETFTRCPTYDELKRVKYQFSPETMAMALYFPPSAGTRRRFLNDHPTTLHLIECAPSTCF